MNNNDDDNNNNNEFEFLVKGSMNHVRLWLDHNKINVVNKIEIAVYTVFYS
jgi:hypothetical protein